MARTPQEGMDLTILAATLEVVSQHGTTAPVSLVARQAGIAQGTVFNYFPSKASLFNAAYLLAKTELYAVIMDGLPADAPARNQLRHIWNNWMQWGVNSQSARLAVTRLDASEEITQETRQLAIRLAEPGVGVLRQVTSSGPLEQQPVGFIAELTRALADTTIAFAALPGENRSSVEDAGFNALLRALGAED